MHIKKLLDNGRKKVNQLHKVISNRNVNLSTCELLWETTTFIMKNTKVQTLREI